MSDDTRNRISAEILSVWTEMPFCEQLTDAVKEYLGETARKHNCLGFGCSFCAANGYRYSKLCSIIYFLLNEKGIPMMTRMRSDGPRGNLA